MFLNIYILIRIFFVWIFWKSSPSFCLFVNILNSCICISCGITRLGIISIISIISISIHPDKLYNFCFLQQRLIIRDGQGAIVKTELTMAMESVRLVEMVTLMVMSKMGVTNWSTFAHQGKDNQWLRQRVLSPPHTKFPCSPSHLGSKQKTAITIVQMQIWAKLANWEGEATFFGCICVSVSLTFFVWVFVYWVHGKGIEAKTVIAYLCVLYVCTYLCMCVCAFVYLWICVSAFAYLCNSVYTHTWK